MADDECRHLLDEAVNALRAKEPDVMLERAVAARRCASPNLEAEALYWMAMAHDALGQHVDAERIWRQARDHPAANASHALLSLKAACNLNSLPHRTGDEAVRERRAVALDLAERLRHRPNRTFSELQDVACMHLHTLMALYESVEVLPLAEAILASQHSETATLPAQSLGETRRCDRVAKLDLRMADDAQQRFDEIAGGDEIALKVIEDWGGCLKQAGDTAAGQLVLTAAWLRLLILTNLGSVRRGSSRALRAQHRPRRP